MGRRFESALRLQFQSKRSLAAGNARGAKRRVGGNGVSARFARVDSEVQSENFLEGGFFGGDVFGFCYFTKTRSVLYPVPHRFNPRGRGSFKTDDLFLNRPSLAHESATARKILLALDILGNIQVRKTFKFVRNIKNFVPQSLNGLRRCFRGVSGFYVEHRRQR